MYGIHAPAAVLPGALLCALLLVPLVWLGHPVVALLTGAALVLATNRRPLAASTTLARYSLQAAIVLLGLKLDLRTLWQLSAQYSALVAGYVLLTLAAGLTLGRLLAVEPASSKLMSAGTAICGGTAIATLSAVVRAEPHQTGVALAIVFLLNVVALLTFPLIGRALELNEVQFGLWSALAIHDTSSVLATAAVYGDRALEVATTVKLGRTLWLIPLVFAMSLLEQRHAAAESLQRCMAEPRSAMFRESGVTPRARVPGFVVLFVVAAACSSLLGLPDGVAAGAGQASKALLVVALFFVGTELTRSTLRRLRGRVLWQALGLWLAVVPLTLAAVVWLG